jgi:protein-disulfide isomerase-like protein with CxxC motif
MEKITIYQFTDPVCVWCWGNEPVMRAIDYLYGNKVGVEYIMGGLIEEITTLYDLKGSKRQIIERANAIMAEHWLSASERHGMPVNTRHMALFSERYPSSFPQSIAYEAARRIDATAAKRLLRRIREATFVEARRTSQIDVLIELAAEVGIDAARFIDEYTTGEAQNDFSQSRMKCRRNGITGFPSYLIKNASTKISLGGYQNISTFHTIIGRLSEGKIKPRRLGPSLANVTDFMRRYQTAYPVEIEVTFGLDRDHTDLMIDELIRGGRLTSEQVGNGRRLAIANAAKAFRVTPHTRQNHHEAKQASAKGSATVASHQKVEQ